MKDEVQSISRETAEEIQSMFKDREGDVSMSLGNVRLDGRKGDMWMPSWFDAPVCLHLSDVPASNRYMCSYPSDHIKTAVSAFDRGSDMTISLSDPSSEGMDAAPLIINGKIHGHTVSVYVAPMIFGDDGLCKDKEGVAYFRFAAMSKAEGSYEKYQSILSEKQEGRR